MTRTHDRQQPEELDEDLDELGGSRRAVRKLMTQAAMAGKSGTASVDARGALSGLDDTIFALATAPGKAALAVVRSRGRAREVLDALAGPGRSRGARPCGR
jgi:hypothetical protein